MSGTVGVVVFEVAHLHPVTHFAVVAEVLPVNFTVVVPDTLVEVNGSTEAADTTAHYTEPVILGIIVTVAAGIVECHAFTPAIFINAVFVADSTLVAPVHLHGTHGEVLCEVFSVEVEDRHQHFLVVGSAYIDTAHKVPHHIAGNGPCVGITGRHESTEGLGHEGVACVVDQLVAHLLSFGELSCNEVALCKKDHTCFLVDHADIFHVSLQRNGVNGKFEVMHEHLEDGFLACRMIVALGRGRKLRHQRHIAVLEHQVIVLVCAMEVGTALVLVAEFVVETGNVIDV